MKKFNKNNILGILLLLGIVFSVVTIVTAVQPNPGHDINTLGGNIVLGDILYGSGTDVVSRMAGAAGFLKSTGAAAPAWSAVNLAASADVGTSILPTANGGTGMAFFNVAGPASTAKTFTFPNANATVLTTNALVTSAQGGTGNGFFAVSGPATSEKIFTFPNVAATVLTTNAAVTVAQGGTGAGTLTGVLVGNGTSAVTAVAGTASQYLRRNAGDTAYEFATLAGGGDMVLASVQTVTGNKTFNPGTLISAAGTTALAPQIFTAGTNLTTPVAGAQEYDGTAYYRTVDTTQGRTQGSNQSIFRLAANGAAIGPTIADYFGTNSAIPTVANGVYEITFYLRYLKTTAGTVTYTLTNTQTYTNLTADYIQSAVGGIATNAARTGAGIVTTTAAAAALPATASLTTAVNHQAVIRAVAEVGTAGNIRLRVTSSAGTITPLRGSYYTVRRLFAGNVGTFAP